MQIWIRAAAIFITIASFCISAANLCAFKVPSAAQLVKSVKRQHPRLLIDAAGFDALRHRIEQEPELQHYDKELCRAAEKLLRAPLPKHELPDGKRLLDTSRRTVDRALVLGMVFRLHGDARFRDRLWEELQTVAAFNDFNPAHFLDTAEMTFAMAIGYDWLYDSWTDQQRATIRRAIVELGLKPGLKVYRSKKGWPRSDFNWNQVCNGGLTVGALAVADEEPALCGEILHDAIDSVPLAMASYGPDGAWGEGPGYWSYATSYTVRMIAALESAMGSDYRLSETRGFNETALFPIYMTGPKGQWFNFSDCSEKAGGGPCLFWLAARFHQPVAAWFADRYSKPSVERLLWEQGPRVDPVAAKLPLDKYFRLFEVVTMRSSWTDPHGLFVGMQARARPVNHQHLDIGSFVLDDEGERWAIDLGSDNYNLPGYFGGKRYEYYRLRAEGHNTLVIKPGLGADQNPIARCKIERFVDEGDRALAVADLSDAYDGVAGHVERGLGMFGRAHLLVQDEVVKPRGDVWWFMHTRAAVTLNGDHHTATLEQNGRKLTARLLSPQEGQFEVLDAVPFASSPHPPQQGDNKGVRKLTVHLTAKTSLRIAVLFLQFGEQPAADEIRLRPLDQWQAGR